MSRSELHYQTPRPPILTHVDGIWMQMAQMTLPGTTSISLISATSPQMIFSISTCIFSAVILPGTSSLGLACIHQLRHSGFLLLRVFQVCMGWRRCLSPLYLIGHLTLIGGYFLQCGNFITCTEMIGLTGLTKPIGYVSCTRFESWGWNCETGWVPNCILTAEH